MDPENVCWPSAYVPVGRNIFFVFLFSFLSKTRKQEIYFFKKKKHNSNYEISFNVKNNIVKACFDLILALFSCVLYETNFINLLR